MHVVLGTWTKDQRRLILNCHTKQHVFQWWFFSHACDSCYPAWNNPHI